MIHFNVFNTCSYTDWDRDREALQSEYPGIYAQSVVDSDRVTNAVNIVECEKNLLENSALENSEKHRFSKGLVIKAKSPPSTYFPWRM